MKVYTLKDSEGILRPKAFLAYEDEIVYQRKEVDRLTKDGSTIVLVEINEI